ncbi:MAG TPA: type II secretion system protein GspC [Candidatus Binataceae bacterium]|nr:type II secretion system protein GspC [Candidatus Binataceae bacterium]
MSFTLSQRYITALNFVLIAIIVYFLAQSVSAAIKLHLTGTEIGEQESNAGAPIGRARIGPRPRIFYDTIVKRDIFNRAPEPEAAPVEDENLNITLIGTSQISGGQPFMIVEDSDGDQSLYRTGDTIPSAGRVLSIGHNRAVILHNGHRVGLSIPNEGEGQVPAQPFTLPRRRFNGNPMYRAPMRFRPYGSLPSKGVHRLSPDRYLVDRSTVNNDLQNLASLFTQIRAIPNLQNGSSNGFRLSEIQPGSIFEQLGLRDGDILTAAQGQSVNDPMKAMALLSSLRDSSAITLNVLRDGSPVQIHYIIH